MKKPVIKLGEAGEQAMNSKAFVLYPESGELCLSQAFLKYTKANFVGKLASWFTAVGSGNISGPGLSVQSLQADIRQLLMKQDQGLNVASAFMRLESIYGTNPDLMIEVANLALEHGDKITPYVFRNQDTATLQGLKDFLAKQDSE